MSKSKIGTVNTKPNFAEDYLKEILPKGAWEYYLAKKAKEELEEAIKKRPTQSHGEAYASYYKMQRWFQENRRKYTEGWEEYGDLLFQLTEYNVNFFQDKENPEYKEEPFKMNPERTVKRLKPQNSELPDTDQFFEITVIPKEGERDEFCPAQDIPPVINTVEWSLHFDPWVSKLTSKESKDKVLKYFNQRSAISDRADIHAAFEKPFQKGKLKMSRVKLHERYRQLKTERQICNRFKHSVILPKNVGTLSIKSKNNGGKGKFSLVTSEQKGMARETDKKIAKYVEEHERTRGVQIPREKLAKMREYSEKLQAQKPR